MNKKNVLKLIAAIAISQLAGLIGSVFTAPNINSWYVTLQKPELAPPNWVFGPVWTTLFLLMGIASFLIWRKGWERKDVKSALSIFGIQLVLNIIWSLLFFGQRSPGAAFIEILIFWIVIAVTIASFAKISKVAAWLLVPYIAWVSFAAYLNYSIWMLN